MSESKTTDTEPAEEPRVLHELAREHGQLAFELKPGQELDRDLNQYKWQHMVAARLHGWTEHDYHEREPVKLLSEDYLAALQSAVDGKLAPHEPAIAPSRKDHCKAVEQTHVHGLELAKKGDS